MNNICTYTLSDVNGIVHPKILICIIYSMMLSTNSTSSWQFANVWQGSKRAKKSRLVLYIPSQNLYFWVNYSFNRRSVFPSIPIGTDWTSFFLYLSFQTLAHMFMSRQIFSALSVGKTNWKWTWEAISCYLSCQAVRYSIRVLAWLLLSRQPHQILCFNVSC